MASPKQVSRGVGSGWSGACDCLGEFWFTLPCGWVVSRPMRYFVTGETRIVGSTPAAEARFYQSLLTELQSGIGIRSALSSAIEGFDDLDLSAADRRLQTGSAMTSVMDALSPSLRHTGDLARAALELGAETGGDLRPVVGDLVVAATELDSVEREVKVQTAQARLSAALVGLLPVAVAVILMVARGGLPTEAVGRTLVLAGLAFQVVGLSIVAWMLRR